MSHLTRRDFLKLGGAALLTTALRGFNFQNTGFIPPPIVYHGNRYYHKIALTIDDCWHPDVLEQLNEMVAPYPDFHFTFFAVGDEKQSIFSFQGAAPAMFDAMRSAKRHLIGSQRRLLNRGCMIAPG